LVTTTPATCTGFQSRDGRSRAGAADVDVDGQHPRGLLLGRELVRDGPARCPADETEFALQGEVIQLVDHAIDIKRQRVALRANATEVIKATIEATRGFYQMN
jgi:hypothetical protein